MNDSIMYWRRKKKIKRGDKLIPILTAETVNLLESIILFNCLHSMIQCSYLSQIGDCHKGAN